MSPLIRVDIVPQVAELHADLFRTAG